MAGGRILRAAALAGTCAVLAVTGVGRASADEFNTAKTEYALPSFDGGTATAHADAAGSGAFSLETRTDSEIKEASMGKASATARLSRTVALAPGRYRISVLLTGVDAYAERYGQGLSNVSGRAYGLCAACTNDTTVKSTDIVDTSQQFAGTPGSYRAHRVQGISVTVQGIVTVTQPSTVELAGEISAYAGTSTTVGLDASEAVFTAGVPGAASATSTGQVASITAALEPA